MMHRQSHILLQDAVPEPDQPKEDKMQHAENTIIHDLFYPRHDISRCNAGGGRAGADAQDSTQET